MSLLAQPRRRQIISRNPQGKNDSDLWKQFGTKLMQKSGWTDGDGLGHNRQGATDHLQIQFKDDSRGLGCSIQYEQNWLAHGDDFNALLASLNAEHGETKTGEDSSESTPAEESERPQPESLEKKSKGAKGRIHYHKFTRGKDLSSRSVDEISKIFGGKMPKKKSALVKTEEELSKSDCVPAEEKVTGLKTFQSNESINDYFAKKMALKKVTGAGIFPSTETEGSSNNVEKFAESSSNFLEEEIKPEISNALEEEEEESKEERRRKRRMKKAALAAEASLTETVESVDFDFVENSNEKILVSVESKEERRLRKLARRAKKMENLEEKTISESDFLDLSVGLNPTTETVVNLEKTALEFETKTDLPNGDSAKEDSANGNFFAKPPFGISMKSVRYHLSRVTVEARATMFPGANIFDINGYGDELFF